MGNRLTSMVVLISLVLNSLTPTLVWSEQPTKLVFDFPAEFSLHEVAKQFENQAADLGIDLKDPTVKAQYEKAKQELAAKYAKQKSQVAQTNPSTFAVIIADSIKKIKALELELVAALPVEGNPYRVANADAQANLSAKLELLEDEMLKLHVYLQSAQEKKLKLNADDFFMPGYYMPGNYVPVLILTVVAMFLTGITVGEHASTAKGLVWFLIYFFSPVALLNGVIFFKDLKNNFVPRGLNQKDRAKYLAQVQKELKKMLEPAELKAAKEILDYVENYGCNVIAEGMQVKAKPKFRVAPEETMGAGKTKYRIEAGGSATTAEIEAAQAAEQETQKLKHLAKPVSSKP